MKNFRMENYYKSSPQFANSIKIFVQDIINEDKNFEETWEFFEHDGKYFDVHIFKDKTIVKAYVYWTLFVSAKGEDLFVTQKHDVMPLGYFQGIDMGADNVA